MERGEERSWNSCSAVIFSQHRHLECARDNLVAHAAAIVVGGTSVQAFARFTRIVAQVVAIAVGAYAVVQALCPSPSMNIKEDFKF